MNDGIRLIFVVVFLILTAIFGKLTGGNLEHTNRNLWIVYLGAMAFCIVVVILFLLKIILGLI